MADGTETAPQDETRGGDNPEDWQGPETPSAAPLRIGTDNPLEQAASARQIGNVWTSVSSP